MDDVDVTVPFITANALVSFSPGMQELLARKYDSYVRWQKRLRYLARNPPSRDASEAPSTRLDDDIHSTDELQSVHAHEFIGGNSSDGDAMELLFRILIDDK
ncbi:hypothetical protein MRX96_011540 [Rhipicephalus microplus]